MTQALNLHDVGFVLWWLAFAALTNVGDDPNATVFLEVLVKRAAYASEAVFPGLAQADAALRDILSPHAEDWYKPHGLRVYAAVMAQQVRDARACYRPADGWFGLGPRCVQMRTFWTVCRSLHRRAISTQHTHHTRNAPTNNIARVRARKHAHAGVFAARACLVACAPNSRSSAIQPINRTQTTSAHNHARTITSHL